MATARQLVIALGILTFLYHGAVKPVAHGARKVAHVAYKVVV